MLKKISIALTTALFAALALAPGASAATPTTLTTLQKAQIKFMVEEEKMARDVYTYLAAKITTRKFTNISRSEQTHMNYMSTLITKYKLSNPTTGKAGGRGLRVCAGSSYTRASACGVARSFGKAGLADQFENCKKFCTKNCLVLKK